MVGMYFTLANHPQNVMVKRILGYLDFFVDWRAWTAPVHGGSVINDGSYNAVAGFSADGNQLFLVNHLERKEALLQHREFRFSKRNRSGLVSP